MPGRRFANNDKLKHNENHTHHCPSSADDNIYRAFRFSYHVLADVVEYNRNAACFGYL